MHDDLYDGLQEEIAEGTTILLDRGWSAERVLNDALVEGMRIVGIDFRDGILFVPEVLLSANAMKAGMEILRPLLAETGAESVGKVVIGTVKGDIHDIGKNLVAMMLEGAGFEVIDLGINTDVDEFLAALDEHQPDILGMSALLTTTMPYMKVVIDTLIDEGRRDDSDHPRRAVRRSTRSSAMRSARTGTAGMLRWHRRWPNNLSRRAAAIRNQRVPRSAPDHECVTHARDRVRRARSRVEGDHRDQPSRQRHRRVPSGGTAQPAERDSRRRAGPCPTRPSGWRHAGRCR